MTLQVSPKESNDVKNQIQFLKEKMQKVDPAQRAEIERRIEALRRQVGPFVRIGERFGRLRVLESLEKGRCLCECACGGRRVVAVKDLRRKGGRNVTSCGCIRRDFNV